MAIANAFLLLALTATAASATLAPDQATWVHHESATVARVGHQLFHEAGTRGYIAQGGFSYGAANANVSAYGPSTPLSPQAFERTEASPSFPAAYGHAATRWRESQWYLFHGGVSAPGNMPADASVYLYDRAVDPPAMVTLHAVENGTASAPPLVHHEMAFVGNHSYIVGGRMQDGSASAAVFAISSVDPGTSSVAWSAVDTSSSGLDARFGHCVVPFVSAAGAEMLVIGGIGPNNTYADTVHKLFQSDSMGLVLGGTSGSSFPPKRAYHTCSPFPRFGIDSPGVVVFGGMDEAGGYPSTVHVFDADASMWTALTPSVEQRLADMGFNGHGARFLAQAYAETMVNGVMVTVHGGGVSDTDAAGGNDFSRLFISTPSAVVCPTEEQPFLGHVAACAFNGTHDPAHACECLADSVGQLQTTEASYPDCHEVQQNLAVLQDMQSKSCFAGQANCTQLYLGISTAVDGCQNRTTAQGRCECSEHNAQQLVPWLEIQDYGMCPLNDEFIALTGCTGQHDEFCYPDEQGSIHECEMHRGGAWAFTCRNATLGVKPCPDGHVFDGRHCVPICQ